MADTAHSFGASQKGVMTGALADFSSFSFHAVKNLTTAEGGALTWKTIPGIDNEAIYKQLQLFSLHGQSKDALAKTKLGAWEYDIVGPWFKCNMTDVAAAIGLSQMKRYGAMLARRKEIISRFDAAFKPLGVLVLPHYTENHQSSGHLYLTRIPGITPEQRNEIITKMAQRGVACNVHYKPLPMHTAYKNMGFDIAIKIDSPGPVFYRQVRVTQYGKHFRIFKFRSMVANADKIGTQVTVGNDSRITRMGKLIRKCRLDELCQLIDVLRGTMSFVGTRPEVPKYVDAYTPEMMATLLLPAGVTSLASILYKDEDQLLEGAEDVDKVYIRDVLPGKMRYNLKAIENFGFWKDIKTMFMTVFAVLGKEYREESTSVR